jgi:hypothetical protein
VGSEKFCSNCGTPVGLAKCTNCGNDLPPGCGSATADAAVSRPSADERSHLGTNRAPASGRPATVHRRLRRPRRCRERRGGGVGTGVWPAWPGVAVGAAAAVVAVSSVAVSERPAWDTRSTD